MGKMRKPLVLDDNGNYQQLQPGDTLDATAKEVDAFDMVNESLSPIGILSPTYISSSGKVKPAQANAPATAKVIGLTVMVIAASSSGSIQSDGQITGTLAQWDAVTGQTGGLTPGATYYLDETNPGKLRVTPPNTGSLVIIGDALSETTLDLNIEKPILL
jgi:hypothetical protein